LFLNIDKKKQKKKMSASSSSSLSLEEEVGRSAKRQRCADKDYVSAPRAEKLDYGNGKHILAPMVATSMLPVRLTCLKYGGDIVYGPELIDYAMLNAERVVVKREGTGIDTVEYVDMRKKRVLYRTCARERGVNVFQIGTSDGVRAWQAVSRVERDVAGVDVNMGCPKHFSVHAGMGAALLGDKQKASDILKTLRRNLSVPLTCKIRLLDTDEKTVEFARMCEMAGVEAIGVHMRERHHRPSAAAQWNRLSKVVDAVQVPVIGNGGVWKYGDIAAMREATGCASVMVAQGFMNNPAVFVPDEQQPSELEMVCDIARNCIDVGFDTETNNDRVNMLFYRLYDLRETRPESLPPAWLRAELHSRCRTMTNVIDVLEHEPLRAYYDRYRADNENVPRHFPDNVSKQKKRRTKRRQQQKNDWPSL
jgi:tRNA-dihydrouridine synthase 2